MKSVFSVAIPALLLMSATAFAADQTSANMQPSGSKSDQSISAGTGGLQGSQTGQGYMNGPNGDGSAGNGGSLGSGPSNTTMAANSGSSDTMSSPSVSATTELSLRLGRHQPDLSGRPRNLSRQERSFAQCQRSAGDRAEAEPRSNPSSPRSNVAREQVRPCFRFTGTRPDAWLRSAPARFPATTCP